MEIKVAKTAGFCFGVKRAVELVEKQVEAGKKVYTYGPIIHNEEVIDDLAKKGVEIVSNAKEWNNVAHGTLIIRSHGVSKREYEDMLVSGHEILDATCPFVKKIHKIVEKESNNGRHIVIIGSKEHPEVQGIIGWANGPVTVIETAQMAEELEINVNEKLCIVAQTTFNSKKFQDLVEIIRKKRYDIIVLSTICSATEERQKETRLLAQESEAMVVIGGLHSSNTRKLYEISKQQCVNTYFIQKLSDLDLNLFKSSFRSVGITAGASTPNNIIEEVHTSMSDLSFEQLLEESFKTIHNGEVVEGTVIRVKEDEIVLNIGYKADGIITRSEYTNTPNVDLTTVVKEGDKMQAKVLKVNDGEGQVLLTYKRLAAEKGSKRLEEAFNNKSPLTLI